MYCCLEHVELALDIAVDEQETAPVLEKTNEADSCEFCENQAIYVVGN
ncbi:CxxH/CxxC protein [Domibacillus antri]|uniref:CxxH/CxxC protein n=1 Tax=Domibacillus antri TaxID=1714264 RepID=A0A1Q8Q4M3_9BACI|nr:CxxH/CxxC protein [Domibacillus antri]OLN22303.1 CxxH/CxxC protein [Domibacillus antri]